MARGVGGREREQRDLRARTHTRTHTHTHTHTHARTHISSRALSLDLSLSPTPILSHPPTHTHSLITTCLSPPTPSLPCLPSQHGEVKLTFVRPLRLASAGSLDASFDVDAHMRTVVLQRRDNVGGAFRYFVFCFQLFLSYQ